MNIRMDAGATVRGLDNFAKQFAYATVRGLNALANAGQTAQREMVKREFTLRQEAFILRTIYRMPSEDFATKQKLSAGYRIHPDRDILAKFESGGEKVAIQGKPYVAIPLPDLRRTKKGLVPKTMRPKALGPFTDKGEIAYGQKRTFIVPTRNDKNRLMLQRFGGTRGKHGLRALYLFVPSVHIDPMLHFQETARHVAETQWPRIFAQELEAALRTAR